MDVDGGGNNDDNNDDVKDGDNDNGMARMQWRQQQRDNNNLMAMGSQRGAECLRDLCQPSKATINLCRQFGEKSMRERDNFWGREDRKRSRWKRLGGDHFISTQSNPNQLSAHPRVAIAWDPILHVSWE